MNEPATRTVFGYQTPILRRSVPFLVFVSVVVAALLTLVSVRRHSPPLALAIVFDVIVAWMAYQFLWNIGHTIEVDGDTVMWWSVFRRRRVRLADLSGNDSLWLGFDRLKVTGQRPLHLAPNDRTWLQFLERLDSVHPDRSFAPTRSNRILASRLFRSGHIGFTEREV